MPAPGTRSRTVKRLALAVALFCVLSACAEEVRQAKEEEEATASYGFGSVSYHHAGGAFDHGYSLFRGFGFDVVGGIARVGE